MKSSPLSLQIYLQISPNLTTKNLTPKFLIPKTHSSSRTLITVCKIPSSNQPIRQQKPSKPFAIELIKPIPRGPISLKTESFPNGWSRNLIISAASLGFALMLMGDNKAMAFGFPEGPLVEEFWDNVRRYGLYALTVSTGAIWAIFEPIYELLKNPISAILVVVIFLGGFFILSQVLSAMVGVSEFSYDYVY